jgi:hypothetical protein
MSLSPRFVRLAVRFFVVLALIGPLTAWTFRAHGYPWLGIDDANIFFVYAEHLAGGEGLVYNMGGERVEGFTSLLWVLLCGLWFSQVARPEPIILLMCVVLTAATLTAVMSWIDDLDVEARPARWLPSSGSLIFVVCVLATPAYLTWMTITLMDVALWGLVVVLLALGMLRNGTGNVAWFHGLIGAALITRPESLLLVPVVIALVWVRRVAATGRPGWHGVQWYVLTCVCVAVALTAFRLSYFGYPLPNTYYAKVSPALSYNIKEGIAYLMAFVELTPTAYLSTVVVALVCVLAVARLVAAIARRQIATARGVLVDPLTSCAAVSALLLLLPVFGGGDHFAWSRFYQPAYPMLVLTMVLTGLKVLEFAGRSHVLHGLRMRVAVPLLLGAVLIAAGQQDTNWRDLGARPLQREFDLARTGYAAGLAWREVFSTSGLPAVGVLVAGGFKRSYPGEVIDLLGLNHVRMGHSPGSRFGPRNHAAFDAATFFDLRPLAVVPDVDTAAGGVTMGVAGADLGGYHVEMMKGVTRSPQFRAVYSYAWVSVADRTVRAYFERRFLDEIGRRPGARVRHEGD